MKKRILTLLPTLTLLAGLGLLLYPSVSNWWNSMHQSRAIASYSQAVDSMETAKYQQILDGARSYNQTLFAAGQQWDLNEEALANYEATLNISGSGIMGYIEIPSINVSLPIYHGTGESVLQTAVGHIPGSSLPVGGENTHAVLSGHRGLPSARLFTHLDQLQTGDLFMIHVLDKTLTYEVDQILTVEPSDSDALCIEPGQDLVTLVTCTPYGINTHRLLVRGHRVENQHSETVSPEAPAAAQNDPQVGPLLIAAVVIVLLLLLLLLPKRKKLWA